MTATECRNAIKEKREQRAEIQARLANATGKERLSLRLEDARLAEDINTLGRTLRDLMPQHHIGEKRRNGERTGARRVKSGGWSRLETMTWNEIGLKTWAELEAETNSEEISRMARAARETLNECSSILSEKQAEYFAAVGRTMANGERGRPQREVAAEVGVDASTVSRTVIRARGRIRKEAQQRYEFLKNACEDGGIRLDVSDKETMELLLSTLTERQLLYMVLYYGNWMSTREVGKCLNVDHATVARTIGRGLDRLSLLVSDREVELSGVPALEMRIMECLNDIPPEKPKAQGRPQKPQAGKRWVMVVSEKRLRLRRGLFLTVTEKGELGEWLKRKKGFYALVLGAIKALKNTFKRKGGNRA